MARPTSRVSRVLMTGPLAPFAGAYRVKLKVRGYTPRSAVNELRQVARLSSWLDERGVAVTELTAKRVDEFLAVQRASGRHRAQWSRPGLVCLLEMLRDQGVRAAEEPARAGSPDEALLESFDRYLLEERGLAAGTVHGYVGHARRFLGGLSESPWS